MKVIDAEGDIWVLRDDERWYWLLDGEETTTSLTRKQLDKLFGPVTVIPE